MCSLQESPYFSILADECQDIGTQEELSICGRWLVNGKPEEHFLMVLHVHSTDAGTITEALVLLTAEATWSKKVDWPRIRWCCYICWESSGVHKRIQTSSAHVIYIHCSCHRLQLASIQAAASAGYRDVFWNHHQRLEVALKGIQDALGFPSWRSWSLETLGGCCMSVVLRQFARDSLHCSKSFHSYTSHLEMLRHMVYTPFCLDLMVYQAVIFYLMFSVPLLS